MSLLVCNYRMLYGEFGFWVGWSGVEMASYDSMKMVMGSIYSFIYGMVWYIRRCIESSEVDVANSLSSLCGGQIWVRQPSGMRHDILGVK